MEALPVREYRDWLEFMRLEPFGALRDNLHAGMVASMVANFSGRMKRGHWLDPKEFLLKDAVAVRTEQTRNFFAALRRRAVSPEEAKRIKAKEAMKKPIKDPMKVRRELREAQRRENQLARQKAKA